MTVEILKSEDIVSYKELIDECFGSSSDIEKYQNYCNNHAYTVFVVKDGIEIIGSATQYPIDLFTFDFQPSIMIFNMAVKPVYRGQKIGQLLLEHIIDNAKAEGYRSITLTCLENAYSAHKLYESVGFKKTSSIKYEMYL